MFFKNFVFSAIILIIALPASAFTYNQKMIEYKGGVISELNNCGPAYSDGGKYLLGQRNLSAKLTKTSNNISSFEKVADGVVSVLENGEIFFSLDGRYLDGGGGTIKLTTIENRYVTQVTKFGAEYENYINTSGVLGNQFFVLQTKKDKDYFTNKVVGQSCTYVGRVKTCKNVYESAYGSQVLVFDLPSGSMQKFIYKSASRRMNKVLGASNGVVYVQFSNGDIGSFSSLGMLNGIDTISILHSIAPSITKVIPYRHGLLAYNKNSVFWSSNASQIVSGSGVT
ncbi:MAG: hypothetical protein K0Q78_1266, partial [Cellvibrio sp.]|nr:hypothetical protein [Cellvibrio sp.]